jgi:hypothetical protein
MVHHGRIGLPVFTPKGSLYDDIRSRIASAGGTISRDMLNEELATDASCLKRIAEVGGLSALLTNMHHSGEVILERKVISLTERAKRRMAKQRGAR